MTCFDFNLVCVLFIEQVCNKIKLALEGKHCVDIKGQSNSKCLFGILE